MEHPFETGSNAGKEANDGQRGRSRSSGRNDMLRPRTGLSATREINNESERSVSPKGKDVLRLQAMDQEAKIGGEENDRQELIKNARSILGKREEMENLAEFKQAKKNIDKYNKLCLKNSKVDDKEVAYYDSFLYIRSAKEKQKIRHEWTNAQSEYMELQSSKTAEKFEQRLIDIEAKYPSFEEVWKARKILAGIEGGKQTWEMETPEPEKLELDRQWLPQRLSQLKDAVSVDVEGYVSRPYNTSENKRAIQEIFKYMQGHADESLRDHFRNFFKNNDSKASQEHIDYMRSKITFLSPDTSGLLIPLGAIAGQWKQATSFAQKEAIGRLPGVDNLNAQERETLIEQAERDLEVEFNTLRAELLSNTLGWSEVNKK